jgi:hypothetical protein
VTLSWHKLTDLVGGKDFTIERVRTVDDGIAVEGDFELPLLARLDAKDQSYVAAFIHCHGSIKQMERWFGVSYPTIKARLNRIAEQLDFAELVDGETLVATTSGVLDRLESGDIDADEALVELAR